MATVLKLAVCIFDEVANLDYQGSIELFGILQAPDLKGRSPYVIEATYVSYTKNPVKPMSGPRSLPDRSFDEVRDDEQFDIIFVPGGFGSRPEVVQPPFLNFIKKQAPGAKYVLSVCTGSWILAQAGILEGKRATTNKSLYKVITGATSGQSITWIPKARWVVDGNIWTASGVVAGIDMGNAFLEHLVGPEITATVRGIAEVSAKGQGDDEFAAYYGLV